MPLQLLTDCGTVCSRSRFSVAANFGSNLPNSSCIFHTAAEVMLGHAERIVTIRTEMLKPDVVVKRSDCFFGARLTYKHLPESVPRAM